MNIKKIKKGSPHKDVIIPIGISEGAIKVLDNRSETVIKIIPRIPEKGITILLSQLIAILTICGITNPIKPIIPAVDTQHEVITDEKKSTR